MPGNAHVTPGWYGKLPGIGDFAHRRLPEGFRDAWDLWLRMGLASLRERHDDWLARYLEGRVWFFMLGEQLVGPRAWVGVLMPSVDGVGRYFPFTVAVEMPRSPDAVRVRQWWALAAQAALSGLEEDLDAVGFDALLTRTFQALPQVEDQPHAAAAAEPLQLPAMAQSRWCTDPAATVGAEGECMTTAGLPRGPCFDALFGFLEPSSVASAGGQR